MMCEKVLLPNLFANAKKNKLINGNVLPTLPGTIYVLARIDSHNSTILPLIQL